MAIETINVGTVANDGTGDTLRSAFQKVNTNFIDVQDQINAIEISGGGGGLADLVSDTSPELGGNLVLNGFQVGPAIEDDFTKLHAVTATSDELNYVDGVTSSIQTQLDAKQPIISDADQTDFTKLSEITVTSTEINYLSGTTSGVQAQIDLINSGILGDITVTATEINYLDGVTSLVQNQINAFSTQTEGEGASLIGIENVGDALFSGATTVQGALEYLAENSLLMDEAADPEEIFSIPANSKLLVALPDGGYGWIEAELLLGSSAASVIVTNETNLNLTTDHINKTIYFTSSSPCTATISLQSVQEFPPDCEIRLVEDGSGALSLVCGDPSIVLNNAADSVVAAGGRNNRLVLRNKTSDVWNCPPGIGGSTADVTAPTLVSVNPENGSTILASQPIEFIFDESILQGTGNFIERVDTGSGFTDGTVKDITDALGTSDGDINIIENVLTWYPASPRTAEANIAYRMASGVITDASDTPNAYAGLLSDDAIVYTVAAAVTGEIETVAEGSWVIPAGGSTATRTMSVSPSTGDMVLLFMAAGAAITAAPTGFTDIMNKVTAPSGPPCYVGYRVEGVTPSNEIDVPQAATRKVIAGWKIIRGTGGTLSISGASTPVQSTAFTLPVNAPAYVQSVADEYRVIFGATKNHDITPTTTDLEADGWNPGVTANTGQGSTTGGATIMTASFPQGGSISTSIDPDAWGTAGMNWWAIQFGIKET